MRSILCVLHTAQRDRALNRAKEMMGLIGIGNKPMVGATVAVAVAVEEAMRPKVFKPGRELK